MHILDWDGRCPYCGSRDISVQSVTRFNEHWECSKGHWFYVPKVLSQKVSQETGVRCIVDDMVADMCSTESTHKA